MEHEISFEVGFQTSLDVLPSSRIPESLRLILTSEWRDYPDAHRVVPHPVLPSMWAKLILSEGAEVPLNLSPTASLNSSSDELLWTSPKSADEIESAKRVLGDPQDTSLIPTLSVDESEGRLMQAATMSYPEGHSEWANRMESVYPLVSWIASEPNTSINLSKTQSSPSSPFSISSLDRSSLVSSFHFFVVDFIELSRPESEVVNSSSM